MASNPEANQALFSAQKIVAVGTSFRNNLCLPSRPLVSSTAEILLVDFDADDVSPHLNVGRMFFAPPSSGLEASLHRSLRTQSLLKFHSIEMSGSLHLPDANALVDLNALALELVNLLPEDAIVVVDSGFCQLIISGQGIFNRSQRLVRPHSQGCMGVALAAGFGVAKAHPGSPVVIIVGDGSLVMNPQDLISIASIPKNLVVVVVDKGPYAIISKRQKELFRSRTLDSTHNFDFVWDGINLLTGFNWPQR